MRSTQSLVPYGATLVTAFVLVAAVILSPDFARADEARFPDSKCSCPVAKDKPSKPKFAELRPNLDPRDEIAALEGVQFALSRIADGSTYVWHRRGGQISGIVRPTSSFRDGSGSVCRRLVVVLTSGRHTSKAEGVACRQADRSWVLQG